MMQERDDTQTSVRLPGWAGDGMVLQRGEALRFWGWAPEGKTVAVSFLGQRRTARAGADNRWAVTLSAPAPGGPYELTVAAGSGWARTLRDVWVGDVWVCAGQSNMELPMARLDERYAGELARAENEQIRQLAVPQRYDFHAPHADIEPGPWTPVRPDTIRGFTGVGYFFAKELYTRYHIPIGLANTAVGGTPVEAWMSEKALAGFPGLLAPAARCRDDGYVQSTQRKEAQREQDWNRILDENDPGLTGAPRWYDPALDDAGWSDIELPNYWADEGVAFEHGSIWFRKTLTLPPSAEGAAGTVWMGRVVDADTVYLNGVPVGSTGYMYPPRRYAVPAGLLRAGKNVLAVHVVSMRGKGGFIHQKPYRLAWGGESVSLAGAWKYRAGASMPALPPTTFFQYMPTGLYNGALAPLFGMDVKGVIWYQGESNTERPEDYGALFQGLINEWRERWGRPGLPFLFVQLPGYLERENPLAVGKWPLLREAQARALALPHTAMATAIDLGEWNDLHPLDKADVGARLARAARSVAYGETDIEPMGPLFERMEIEGDRALLFFAHAGSGLISRNADGLLRQFELRGEDGRWYPARAVLRGNRVEVSFPQVRTARAVRYAWRDNPGALDLYSGDGLPAAPFRTDGQES